MGSPLEYFNFNHLRYFSAVSLKKILNRHGFRIIKETKKPIEFNDGYTYYVCKKTKTKNYHKKFNSIKTNSEDFLNSYYLYLGKYYKICNEIKILKSSKKIKNLRQKKRFIKKNNVGLLSKSHSSINRYFKESQKFLKFLSNSNIEGINL